MSFKLIVIAGPTASGKTALAEKISAEFNIPILSADSRQFYSELRIGTARPDILSSPHLPYYFCGDRSMFAECNAGDFEKACLALIEVLQKKYTAAILCGGSGLYIDAVCNGFDDLPKADEGLRAELNNQYKTEGLAALVNQLPKQVFDSMNTSDQKNPQRLMRRIEIERNGGAMIKQVRPRSFDMVKFQVSLPREVLYERINARVDHMMQEGLLQEVQSVYHAKHLNSLKTVGYQELFEYMDGLMTLDEAVTKIKQHTRNYAKRQITWFGRDSNYIKGTPDELYQKIEQILKTG